MKTTATITRALRPIIAALALAALAPQGGCGDPGEDRTTTTNDSYDDDDFPIGRSLELAGGESDSDSERESDTDSERESDTDAEREGDEDIERAAD